MNKNDTYKYLFKLGSQGIDVSDQIKLLAVCSDDQVDQSIIDFINVNTIPGFISSLKDKKFFKTITNNRASDIDKAKALSSLLTHTLIEGELTSNSLSSLSRLVYADEAIDALRDFMINEDNSKVRQVTDKLQALFEKS